MLPFQKSTSPVPQPGAPSPPQSDHGQAHAVRPIEPIRKVQVLPASLEIPARSPGSVLLASYLFAQQSSDPLKFSFFSFKVRDESSSPPNIFSPHLGLPYFHTYVLTCTHSIAATFHILDRQVLGPALRCLSPHPLTIWHTAPPRYEGAGPLDLASTTRKFQRGCSYVACTANLGDLWSAIDPRVSSVTKCD